MWHNDTSCIMLYHIELLHALIVLVLRLYYTILVLYLQAKSHFPCHSHLQELLSMIPCALATVNQSTIVNPSSEGTCDISETDPKCHLLNPDGKKAFSQQIFSPWHLGAKKMDPDPLLLWGAKPPVKSFISSSSATQHWTGWWWSNYSEPMLLAACL